MRAETNSRPILIAEIGNNHLGDVARAREMIAQTLKSGVDCITFQVREEAFYEAPKTAHLRLPDEFFREAAETIHNAGRRIGIAICDLSKIGPLDAMGIDFWKTLSWDFRNETLRAALRVTAKPVYYSTGVSGMQDVLEASQGLRDAVLIHTQLSQGIGDVNLKAIHTMRRETGLPVAFGLHCHNLDVLQVALGFEPHSIFFYVKMDGLAAGDDEHAVPIEQLTAKVSSLHELASSIGSGIKTGMETPAWTNVSK